MTFTQASTLAPRFAIEILVLFDTACNAIWNSTIDMTMTGVDTDRNNYDFNDASLTTFYGNEVIHVWCPKRKTMANSTCLIYGYDIWTGDTNWQKMVVLSSSNPNIISEQYISDFLTIEDDVLSLTLWDPIASKPYLFAFDMIKKEPLYLYQSPSSDPFLNKMGGFISKAYAG